MKTTGPLGISGQLAQVFITSRLTLPFLLLSLAIGMMAYVSMGREEEPQISVPMVMVSLQANGLDAPDLYERATQPLEEVLKGIAGVEHSYSRTADDAVLVMLRFAVGTGFDEAVQRVHERLAARRDRLPAQLGTPQVVGRVIADKAVMTLTLTPQPGPAATRWTDRDLHGVAQGIVGRLIDLPDLGPLTIIGGGPPRIRVEPDPERLALHGITPLSLQTALATALGDRSTGVVLDQGGPVPGRIGSNGMSIAEMGGLLIETSGGRPVYLRDVARLVDDGDADHVAVWHLERPVKATTGPDGWQRQPAVTIAIAKQSTASAVDVSVAVLERVENIRQTMLPQGLTLSVTRDDGVSAAHKVEELTFHMVLASLSIALMIAVLVGWREGVVTLVVIPLTILLTLAAIWGFGITINNVSMFALLFSIGIMVDDAIVVIENIARHWAMKDGRNRRRAAIEAVAEVGNPTIYATLAVIIALLPCLFVSGMMGPYMGSLPVTGSAAMVISFFVAMIFTPWMTMLLSREPGAARSVPPPAGPGTGAGTGHGEGNDWIATLYRRIAGPVLQRRRWSALFLLAMAGLTVISILPIARWDMTVKLMPFTNKEELAVVLDLPPGTSLEETQRTLFAAADLLAPVEELRAIQMHSGVGPPITFTGLVRQYHLRRGMEQGDLQITLSGKADRSRDSHAIAGDVRQRLVALALPPGGRLKVVEVPPGPPFFATLVAEVSGKDAQTRKAVALAIEESFREYGWLADIDNTVGPVGERLRISINRTALERYGVSEAAVQQTLQALLGETVLGTLSMGEQVRPIDVVFALPLAARRLDARMLSTPVAGAGAMVELGELVRVTREARSDPILRHNGRMIEMVMAEPVGRFEAPIYPIIELNGILAKRDWSAIGLDQPPRLLMSGTPDWNDSAAVVWDGEWEMTWVTFRDLGFAFAQALVGIYLLMAIKFDSLSVPLVILLPVPLTLIGIVPGHWLSGISFSATSAVGAIALAGILVRNSILLVDFTNHLTASGVTLREALLTAGAVRARPILLTAVAAMTGALFLLSDPIFAGLGITLLFGLISSTLLTLLAIPAVMMLIGRAAPVPLQPG